LFFAASITIVPIAEEIFFRGFITSLLQKAHAGVWSGYFSALIFSVAHTFPTFQRALDLKIGAPIGPFLLGLICEFIVRKTGSLAPAIAFHSACNATVIIFTMWSPGWLDKLSVFYLR
jgi:membrane protease YdiL (CAAX protease family)